VTEWWSVHVEAVATTKRARPAAPDAIERFADLLGDYDATVTAGSRSWGATIAIEAAEAPAAILAGVSAIRDAAKAAKLPEWPMRRVEALTYQELDAELARPAVPDLVGTREVAKLLNVSRQRLAQLRENKPDFPKPIVELAAGPVWTRAALDTWMASWSRQPGRPGGALRHEG